MVMKSPSSSLLITLTAIFLIVFGNAAFFSNVLRVYPLEPENIPFLVSLGLVSGCVLILILSLLCIGRLTRPVLIAALLLSSVTGYFMDSYNVVIDDAMLTNILQTNTGEAVDQVGWRLLLYVVTLGILPSVLVYKVRIASAGPGAALVSRVKLVVISVALALACILVFGKFYGSFFREHKILRYYANPTYSVYSAIKYANSLIERDIGPLREIGLDAVIPEDDTHRELVIMVVGETARYDRFSINGYQRETNPRLKEKNVISFTNFWSCGTSTAVSVPCMFSSYGHDEFDGDRSASTENLLDVLRHAGVNVLWLDNNSDSKGVADRVPNASYRSTDRNPVCDIECRDEGMLVNLQEYIDSHPDGDILIVLHQMGNHGPAYFKRYPKDFEKFTPVCESKQLEDCTREEIDNAYDNGILYTDYFLSRVIDLLESNGENFEATMVYVSDHGESLGDKGIYLHGLPYLIAPDEQKHVPFILWFDARYTDQEIDLDQLRREQSERYSHDNVFHTVLGLMEIETEVHIPGLDLIDPGR